MLCLALLTSCGRPAGAEEAEYFIIYDVVAGADVINGMPAANMMPTDIKPALLEGGMRFEVTICLEITGDYTVIFEYYNPESTDETEDDYFHYRVAFIGCYTKDEDEVTLGEAEMGAIEYTAGSTYTSDPANAVFSFDGSGCGYWYSEDCEEILDMLPGAVFTVDGDNIKTWTID